MTNCLKYDFYHNESEIERPLEELKASKGDIVKYDNVLYEVAKVFHRNWKACYRLETYQLYPQKIISYFISNDDFCNIEIMSNAPPDIDFKYSPSYLKIIGK